NVLLFRYTGQDDLVVGSDIANRNQPETEPLIGFFINQLALRTDLSKNPTFRELLGRVREVTLEAYAHQDLPFDQLIQSIQPERDMSRSPVFQTKLILQNAHKEVLDLPGLTLSSMPMMTMGAKFDLTLAFIESSAGLAVTAEYNTDLFDEESINRTIGNLRNLIEGAVGDPDRRLKDLPLLTEKEKLLLADWNQTRTDYAEKAMVHSLFEAQAQRTPEGLAIRFGEYDLTYRELNRRANQLAHYLKSLGVGPEIAVGICLEASPRMIVAMMGVLKAGAAYVPLHSTHPLERLSSIIEGARVSVLLTHSELVDSLPACWAQVICLDEAEPEMEKMSGDNPSSKVSAQNLAYMIFTSGSTGTPKGVMIP